MQYTAYKEMLLGFAAGKYFPVEYLKLNPNGGAEINYSAFSSYNASEAYLFMPSGYWPSVYDNTMYPSDFPTDILASMNDGEQKYVIKGTSTDGQYLMLFCINDIWYKTTYAVSNGKVTSFNEFTIEDEDLDAIIYMDNLKVRTDIDINPAHFDDLPTSFSVIKNAEVSLPTSTHVFAYGYNDILTKSFVWYKSYSDIRSSFMLYNKYDLPTSCNIHAYGTSLINTETYIVGYGKYDTLTEFLCAATDASNILCEIDVNECHIEELPTEFTIKIDAEHRLPTELTIKKDEEKNIPTSIHVLVHTMEELPTSCIIKVYVDKKYIPISFTLKQNISEDIPSSIYVCGRLDDAINSLFEIDLYSNESKLPISCTVKQNIASDIKSSFMIVPCNYMESVLKEATVKGTYDIPTLLKIKYDCDSDIATSFVILEANVMTAITSDVFNNGISDITMSFYVKRDAYTEIPTSFAIMLSSNMEALIDGYGRSGICDIPTEMEVIFTGKSEIPTSFVLQVYNSLEAKLRYGNPQYSDVLTSFFIYKVTDVPTSFAIIPVNTMETTSMSYPPCKKTVFTDIIKDSTGYSKTPATNFGNISDVYVGNKHNVKTGQLEHYKSIIGFDTSDTNTDRPFDADYFKYNMVIKAELKLFINRKTTEDIVIDIHQVDYDSWDEYRIAYKDINKMPTTKYVNTVVVPAGSYGYFKFDVTPSFDNWNKIGDKFSFVLTSNTVTSKEILSMSSKEGYYTPQLVLLHYKFYPFADHSDLPSTLEINPEERIPTSFDLISIFDDLLDTTFEIEENILDDTIPTSITIAGMTFEESDISTTWDMIFYPDEDNLKTLFEVNFTNAESKLKTDFEIERDYSYGCYVIII